MKVNLDPINVFIFLNKNAIDTLLTGSKQNSFIVHINDVMDINSGINRDKPKK